jgi:hypothetical protein
MAPCSVAATLKETAQYVRDNIKSRDFYAGCTKREEGTQKTVCRLGGDFEDYAFIVCTKEMSAGTSCVEIIEKELKILEELQKGGVPVVEVEHDVIKGVPCAGEDKVCAGFVTKWLAGDHVPLPVGLAGPNGCVKNAEDIESYMRSEFEKGIDQFELYRALRPYLCSTTATVRAVLAQNFVKIYKFNEEKKLSIEDLQGFLTLANGHLSFTVMDPNGLNGKDEIGLRCQKDILKAIASIVQHPFQSQKMP